MLFLSRCFIAATLFILTTQKKLCGHAEDISQKKCMRYLRLPKINRLIVGGFDVSPSEFPFAVKIGYRNNTWKCGGTIISENFVLTAAHCIYAKIPLEIRTANRGTTVPIKYALVHPLYNPNALYNDIGLLKLVRKLIFSRSVQPACLWPGNDNFTYVIAVGWGETEYGKISKTLKAVELQVLDKNICAESFVSEEKLGLGIVDSMLCVGDLLGEKDTCRGDSGGPILVPSINYRYHYLIGVTSFGGEVCGAKNTPAVYTDVSKFLHWIVANVWCS